MHHSNPQQERMNLTPGSRIYFVGIGGISMSGLAEIAKNSGFVVSGSDRHLSARTEYLERQGIRIHEGHQAANLSAFKPDLVVHTAAVHADNPELAFSRENGILTVDRAAFLGWLNEQFETVINISGTHGKTTTTALCSLMLMDADVDPTVHLGAELKQFHSTVRLGRPGGLMVSEACEYMRSFLKFRSTTAAVLNIDYDHVDCFSDLQDVIDTFTEFADHLPENGQLVVPSFDPNVRVMLNQLATTRKARGQAMPAVWTFGLASDTIDGQKPTVHAANLVYELGMPRFDVFVQDAYYAHIELVIPGRHNVANALAAIACAHLNGGTPESAVRVLNQYEGAEGRFTHTGTYRGALVIADYAHHPAAARATLEAAANIPHKHLWVVFQPLTYSRTKVLFNDYVDALKDCELVIFSEIFSDREVNPGDISSRMISDRINALGGHAVFAEDFGCIRSQLDEIVEPGDLILVLGPEDIRAFADQLTGRENIWA